VTKGNHATSRRAFAEAGKYYFDGWQLCIMISQQKASGNLMRQW